MKRIWAMYFSPTGNTRRIVTAAAEAAAATVEILDFTPPHVREHEVNFGSEDLVFIGVPTYAGRVPNKIMPYIRDMVKGDGTSVVPMVTYGNRSADESLKELSLLLVDNGFRVVGGGSFVCAHAFAHQLAPGRPDAQDLLQAAVLGRAAAAQASAQAETDVEGAKAEAPLMPNLHPLDELFGQGEVGPYYVPKDINGKPANFLKARPLVDSKRCTACGRCVAACPMGSIRPDAAGLNDAGVSEQPFETMGICIKCQACIASCPAGARRFDDEAFLSHKAMLEKNFAGVRRENAIYLP